MNEQPCCPKCDAPTAWEDGPPWDPRPVPEMCAACENEQLQAAEDDRVLDAITAAARAGRFDLL